MLEDELDQKIKGKPLWSAEVIRHSPEVVVNAHITYLRAGAKIIKTATYQCGPIAFENAGMDAQESRELLLKAFQLADDARNAANVQASIALSLGPYGAQIGQEYTGFYPAPYGPDLETTNAFASHDFDKEEKAKDALAQFHYERLLIFASKPEVWDKIDCLAFETIPLLREAQAIQKAVTLLEFYLTENEREMKPWWLSFVFLNGHFPQDSRPNGRKITVSELVRNLCSPIGDGTIPSGIGVNCTVPKDATRFLKSLSHEFLQYSIPQPWLVLYPNGGHGYDVVNRVWTDRDNGETEDEARLKWVAEVEQFCRSEAGKGRGILVGGCCKCGPAYVHALEGVVKELSAHGGGDS